MKLAAAILLFAAWAVPARAQTISATTYPFTSSNGVSLENMSSGTTQLVGPNLDDSASGVTAIGFDFWLVGTRYTQFSVNANGLMRLGGTVVGTTFTNDLASSTNVPQIAPYWDDLFVGTNGKVHYKVVGTAPSRRLVVEWQNVQVPRVGSGNTGAATFQCWLYETDGRIEFVYGAGMATNSTNAGASVGFGSSASTFASVSVGGPTVSYATANNGNTAAIASGTKYSFTPPVPAAPTNLTFTGVSPFGMTLNWTDNATNETGYVLYRSTDGVTYSFVSQLAANSTSSAQSGLSASTTYSWRVHANGEGALSAALAGSQATAAVGTITTTGSGNWSSTVPGAPWPGGVLPTATDDVTIADGHTVTIDAAAVCHALTVGQGASGILQFEAATARTLTAGGDVVVSPGAVLRSALTGTQTGHVFSAGGALTNGGTLDFSTNGNAAGAGLTFTGSADAAFSGAGSVTNVRTLTVNKGSGPGATLTLSPAAFAVQGATSGAPAFLTITNGTFRISGSFAMSGALFSTAGYSIATNAGLWIDNPNFTVTGQNGSPTVNGVLRVSAGTLEVGTSSGNSLQFTNGSTSILEGGAVNVAGRFCVNSSTSRVTYVQSGGTLTVCTVGQSSATLASFDLGTAATSTASMSGGSIVLQNASTAASGPRDFRNRGGGTQDFTGGTLQLGNASTPGATTFFLNGAGPGLFVTHMPAGHTAQLLGATSAGGASLVDSPAVLNLAGFRFTQSQGSLENRGTITGTAAGSELYFLGTTTSQTYSGSGVVTEPLGGNGLTVDNPAGVTIDAGLPQSLITRRVNLVRGVLTNSYKVTLGDTAVSAAIQIGTAGLTDPGGSFDTYPTLHPLLSSLSINYLQEGAARTTGFEVPASLTVDSVVVSNSNGVILAQSSLTVTKGLVLTSGLLHTAASNTLKLANAISSPPAGSASSYVDGPLAIEFIVSGSGTANRTYAIGAGGAFRPLVLKSVNTGGATRVFTAEVIPGATGGTPVSPLLSLASARYWRVAGSSTLSAAARVNLTFGADDNVGTLANLRVAQSASAGGSYASLGGTTTGTQSSGTVESTSNLTPGSDYFAIGSTGQLASTWDGGAGTSNWGDAANWSPDGVPGSGTNVSLALGSPTTINVNGSFSVSNLTVGANATVSLDSGSLAVGAAYSQSAGAVDLGTGAVTVTGTTTVTGGTISSSSGAGTFTSTGAVTLSGGSVTLSGTARFVAAGNFTLSGGTISLGTGTLDLRGAFTRTSGTFTAGSATTLLSGTNTQIINAPVSYYNLILRNGGAGKPKRFTGAVGFVVNNDLTVESTAQIAVTTSDQTDLVLWGNLYHSGVTGGTNASALIVHMRGQGKSIAGVPSGAQMLRATAGDASARMLPAPSRVVESRFRTDPSRARRLGTDAHGKPILELENTYDKKRAEVEELLRSTDPAALLVIDLDDRTIVRNPVTFENLLSAAAGGVGVMASTATIEQPLFVEAGGAYSLGGNVTMNTGRIFTIADGRLDCGGFTVGGAGGVTVGDAGTLATTVNNANGLGATVITTGTNTYYDGAIIEYNAAGDQTINALRHPAAAMIHTAGSGTKTLDADKTITGTSGPFLDQGAILVGAGTTFVDGGHRISFTSPQFDNVIVNGTYLTSGAGSLSYESGPFDSNILAPDGTSFGDLLLNFDLSTNGVALNASGTAGISFRSLVCGGTAGSGTGGGTLQLSETGTTNVTVTGNVSLVPRDSSKSGGGFGGTSAKTSQVTLLGNLTSTSFAATQPILNGTGTNTLVFSGASSETLSVGGSATMFPGSTLRVGTAGDLVLGGSGLTYTIGAGGAVDLQGRKVIAGTNTLALSAGTTWTPAGGRVVGRLQKPVATGAASLAFEIGTETAATPVGLAFGNVSAPGSIAVATTLGDHPNVSTSGIDAARSVNRTYSVTNQGVVFDSCAVGLTFLAGDVDAAANPDSFAVRKFDSPSWSVATTGTRTPTSIEARGVAGFSDFAIGDEIILTIAASAGPNGSISPAGNVPVPYLTTPAFNITPDFGYHVADVLVDSASVGAVTSYTFAAVTSGHTIAASFAINTYDITASAGPHGTVTPPGVSTVSHGGSLAYSIVPDSGYTVGDVVVDSLSVGPVTSYTFSAVTGPHTISATFVPNRVVTVGPAPSAISTAHACVTVPVNFARFTAQPVRGFSVTFTLSSNLELCSGTASITEGTFLSSSGATTFFVRSLGGGAYSADGVVLGAACGPTALTGNLFNLALKSAELAGSGTVAIDSVKLRDCANQALFVIAGDPATILIDNTPPVVTVTSPNGGEVVTVDSTHVITWTATDNVAVGTVDLAYSTDGGASYPHVIAAGLPDSVSYAWAVPNTPSTTARVRIVAHDVNGNTASDSSDADFEIRQANVPPVLEAIGSRTTNEGELLTFTASASDSNLPAQSLSFSLGAGAPAGAAIDPGSGVFTWTPTEAQGPGDYPVTVRVTDDGIPPLADAETLSVHVDEVNLPPVLAAIGSQSVSEGATLGFTASATDPDLPAQALRFSLDPGAPAGAAIDSVTGDFTWTPDETRGSGDFSVTVRVTDVGSPPLADAETLSVHVDETNSAPVLAAIGNRSVDEGALLSFTASASDPDLPAQTLTFSLDEGAPPGAGIDASSGAFTWTPTEAQGPGDYSITVRVTDDGAPPLADAETLSVHVAEANVAPTLAGVPASATIPELAGYGFTATATDPDLPAQTLTFSLAGAPAGASIDGSTGEFSWTPTEAQGPGSYEFSVRVSDGVTSAMIPVRVSFAPGDGESGPAARQLQPRGAASPSGGRPGVLADTDAPIALEVTEVNASPVLSGVPASATIPEQAAYTFTASASDADLPAQTLTFSLLDAPAGASIGASSGVFDWTPSEAEGPGSYAFTVRVSDGSASTEAPITLDVTEANMAPVLSGVPASATIPELAAYTFTASASDADLPAQTLTFSLVDAPAGASIGASSGVFDWTPTEAEGPGSYAFTVRVSDGSASTEAPITLDVTEANVAPVLSGVPASATIPELAAYTFTASASDADLPAQTLTFSLQGAPAGASIGASSGVFDWTPTEAEGPGSYAFTVRVSDGSASTEAPITLDVTEANVAPVLSGVPASATIPELAAYTFTASASDADLPAQTLTFSLQGAPAGASIGASSGVFDWTPSEAEGPGSYAFTVRVSDGSASTEAPITLDVTEANVAPVLSGVPASATIPEQAAYTFTASASDADLPAQALAFSLDAGAPEGATINPSTGAFSWTPSEAQGPGDYTITVRVTDGGSPPLSDVHALSIHVDEVNMSPVLSGVPALATIAELVAFSFTASASDADIPAQALTFSLSGAPAGASIDPSTGAFGWTPAEAQGPGTYPFSVRVSDGPSTTSTGLTVTVDETNTAPVLAAIGNQSVNEGSLLSFTASATDADDPPQTLTYSLDTGAPAGAAIDPNTGVFSWTPAEAQGPGSYPVTVRVTDNGSPPLDDSETITIQVDEVNAAPVLSGVPTSATIPELAAYTFTASASDTDVPAQTLTFSLLGAPSGASIGGSTGVFTWTPSETQGPGVYAFTVQVTDGAANTGAGITLTVTEGNTAPVLAAIGNHSVNEGSLLSFTASATDADDPPQALTYSLDGGAPSGAAIDPNTGAFSWTPTEAQGPGSYPVTVRVTDNGSPPLDDSETITIQVDEVNAAPVLSGVPASATIPELVAYTFTASASDTDLPAQTLTFSLVGAPPGASIGGSTGVFTWTPSEAQGPGVYSFSVSVTDGGANTDAAITLTVDEVTIAAISDLSAAQVTSGNDSDGTTKIGVTWTATPEGTTVEVYRAGFGSYPEYDDAAGQVPATPSYPPGPPWALTSLAAPGGQDEPPTRDFYYYVAFVHGAGQNVSAASNQTQGTLDYHLGDVSDGATAGQGNNLVNTADVSLLGAYYGLSGPAVAPVAYLDVGPTTDFSTDARPITDDKLDFEDLIVFAIGYEVVSKPALAASAGSPAQPAAAADQLDLDAPGRVTPGQSVTARLALLGTGKVQGLSIRLEWDPAVVRPAAVAPSERFQQAGGVVLSARPGTLDAAILGVGAQMLAGRWEVGSMKFEVIGAGDPGIRIAEIRARDAANRKVEVAAGKVAPPRVLPTVTSLSLPAPNPFRQSTAFVVNLAQAARVDLAVYSLDGRRVRTLIDETREAGEYRQSWDGRDQHGATAAPGIYFVRLAAGPRVFTRTIVNLR